MAGTLHIFRLHNAPLEYQVNYNLGAASWVKVLTPQHLDEFLRLGSGLPEAEVHALLRELAESGHATQGWVKIGESHLAEMGFAETPSEV